MACSAASLKAPAILMACRNFGHYEHFAPIWPLNYALPEKPFPFPTIQMSGIDAERSDFRDYITEINIVNLESCTIALRRGSWLADCGQTRAGHLGIPSLPLGATSIPSRIAGYWPGGPRHTSRLLQGTFASASWHNPHRLKKSKTFMFGLDEL